MEAELIKVPFNDLYLLKPLQRCTNFSAIMGRTDSCAEPAKEKHFQ
jgi:hypothetical protein